MVLRAAARPPGYQDMSVLEHNEAEPSPPIGASYERDRAEKFTVDEAVSSIGFGWFQVRLSLMMGFSWVGESMEVMLLSVLSPALHCAWQLSSWKQAFLTTGVFLGMMFGAMFWGWFSDKYGRKKALVTSGWFLFYFGLLSAFSPTYTWLLLLRSTMGFFIGALAQAVTLYSEFLPTKQRGSCILFLNMFWALGSALEVVLALLLMPELGWRWLLALSSVPLLMFVLFSPLIPESVRFHGACGRPDLARAAIDKMAAANGRPAPRGQLTIDDTSSERRGHVWELLSPKLWWTTLLLWCIWWCLTFCYYGVALVSTELFKLPDAELCGSIGVDQEGQVCQASCQMLSQEDYLGLLWTTLSEIPGVLLAMFVIEKVGRKRTIAYGLLIFVVAVLPLLLCIQSRTLLTVVLFVCRGMVAGVFQVAYVYTPEVYPTHLRAIGLGCCGGVSRFGAMITPIVAQVLVTVSVRYTALVYAGVASLAAVSALLLPIETGGRDME